MMVMKALITLGTLALLTTGCQTSGGRPYDLGARLERAAGHLRDREPPPATPSPLRQPTHTQCRDTGAGTVSCTTF